MKEVWRCGFCGGYTTAQWNVCFTCSAPKDRAQQQWFKLSGGDKLKLGDFAKQYNAERKEQFKKTGGNFWKPKVGTNKITVDSTREVTESTGQYGPAVVLPIKIGGKKLTWMINKKSPVLRGIMAKVADGQLNIEIIRTGLKMDTRYTVK